MMMSLKCHQLYGEARTLLWKSQLEMYKQAVLDCDSMLKTILYNMDIVVNEPENRKLQKHYDEIEKLKQESEKKVEELELQEGVIEKKHLELWYGFQSIVEQKEKEHLMFIIKFFEESGLDFRSFKTSFRDTFKFIFPSKLKIGKEIPFQFTISHDRISVGGYRFKDPESDSFDRFYEKVEGLNNLQFKSTLEPILEKVFEFIQGEKTNVTA